MRNRYDRHADYRDVESTGSRLRVRAMHGGHVLLGFFGGVAGACLANLVFWPTGPDAEIAGRFLATLAMVGGFFAGMLIVIVALSARTGHAFIWVATMGVFMFSIIAIQKRSLEIAKAKADRRAEWLAQLELERTAADAWRRRVAKSGQHAPAGTVPPMLDVELRGETLVVRNIGDVPLPCVEIYRVSASRQVDSVRRLKPVVGRAACEKILVGHTTQFDARGLAEPWQEHIGGGLGRPRRRFKTIVKQAESSQSFIVRSGSDRYEIVPREAQVDLPHIDSVDAGLGLHHRVWRIRENDHLTVVGVLDKDKQVKAPPDGSEFPILGRKRN